LYGPLWAASRVCKASPSDLCKADLAQPAPVSVSLSLTPQSATSVHSARRSLPRDLNSDTEAAPQTETTRGFNARLRHNSDPPTSVGDLQGMP